MKKQIELPTLLEWLKGRSESELRVLTGFADVYQLGISINLYGLAAFDVLPSYTQLHILNQYVYIYSK